MILEVDSREDKTILTFEEDEKIKQIILYIINPTTGLRIKKDKLDRLHITIR